MSQSFRRPPAPTPQGVTPRGVTPSGVTPSGRPVAEAASPYVGDDFCLKLKDIKRDELVVRSSASHRGELRVLRKDQKNVEHDCPAPKDIVDKYVEIWRRDDHQDLARREDHEQVRDLTAFYGKPSQAAMEAGLGPHFCSVIETMQLSAKLFYAHHDGELRFKAGANDCPVSPELAGKWLDVMKKWLKTPAKSGLVNGAQVAAVMTFYGKKDDELKKLAAEKAATGSSSNVSTVAQKPAASASDTSAAPAANGASGFAAATTPASSNNGPGLSNVQQQAAQLWRQGGGDVDQQGHPIIYIGMAHAAQLVPGAVYNIDGNLWTVDQNGQYHPAQ